MHDGFHFFAHVVVLVTQFDGNGVFAIFFVDDLHDVLYLFLACLETLTVMVAYDIADGCLFYAALNAGGMEEAFVSACSGRCLTGRKKAHQFLRNKDGILHLLVAIAGVNVHAVYMQLAGCCVEVLVFQFTNGTSVHRISKVASELLYIKVIGSFAYLFVRCKAETDFAVFDFGVLNEIFNCRNYFGYAGFVICAQQRCAIGDDDILTGIVFYFGVFGGLKHNLFDFIENDVLSVVVAYNARTDVLAGSIGRSVHVGNQSDDRFPVGVGRQGGHQIAVAIQFHFFESETDKFFTEIFAKFQLACSGRRSVRVFVRGGMKTDVLQKSVCNVHGMNRFFQKRHKGTTFF